MWQYNFDVLCHWGIKGMKWGVRRYQNRDGTLTAAGKARYSDGSKKGNPDDSKVKKSSTVSGDSKTKSVKEMSDDELNSLISRLQREKQLKALLADEPMSSDGSTKKIESSGHDYVSKALKEGSSQALSTITKTVMLYAGGKIVSSVFNNPELGKSISSAVSDTKKTSSSSDKTSTSSSKESPKASSSKESPKASSSKESPKASSAATSKDDPVNARFREVFNVKFKDIKGEGTSKYKPESDTVIDVDFKDVADTGKAFVNDYVRNQLLLPYNDRDKM